MKILHLIYTNGIAGAEKYLMHLLPGLVKEGFDCHLIVVCAPGFKEKFSSYLEKMESYGTKCSLMETSRFGFISTSMRIAKYSRNNDITYLHSHLLNSDVIATLSKKFNRNLCIISTKHGYKEAILKRVPEVDKMTDLIPEAKRDLYYYVTRWVVKNASYNYAVSKAISNLYFQLKLSRKEMPFIHHGVTVPETISHKSSNKKLVIVGRLEAFKGHRYLIDALPEVLSKFPGLILQVLGEGSQKDQLVAQAGLLGIKKNVEFLGFCSDPYSYVANADIIVLPSLFEPFGLVYIESMALRTPVVAFNTPAGNEILVNDKTGLLAIPRDANDLASKIITLLENPVLANRITEQAYEEYHRLFSTNRMVEDTAAFYRQTKTL